MVIRFSYMQKVEVITDSLRERILSGEFPKGGMVPSESSLCKDYNVSRVTIRASLQKLAGEGLIETHRGKGSIVSIDTASSFSMKNFFSPENIGKLSRIDVFEFRRIIETESAFLAATRAEASDIEAFNLINEKMKNASNTDEMVENDLAFHERIATCTKNPIIIGLFYSMYDSYKKLFYQNFEHVGIIDVSGHRAIVYAIESRNAEEAKSLMLKHLTKTVKQTEILNK